MEIAILFIGFVGCIAATIASGMIRSWLFCASFALFACAYLSDLVVAMEKNSASSAESCEAKPRKLKSNSPGIDLR